MDYTSLLRLEAKLKTKLDEYEKVVEDLSADELSAEDFNELSEKAGSIDAEIASLDETISKARATIEKRASADPTDGTNTAAEQRKAIAENEADAATDAAKAINAGVKDVAGEILDDEVVTRALSKGERVNATLELQTLSRVRALVSALSPQVRAKAFALANGVATKDIYTDKPVGGNLELVNFDPALYTSGLRQAFIRDVVGTLPTDGAVEFTRITGFTNNASAQSDLAGAKTKGKSDLDFKVKRESPKSIAHYTKATRQAMLSRPELEATVRDHLIVGVFVVEDSEILSGIGGDENLDGILSDSDINQVTWSTLDPAVDLYMADAIYRGVVEVWSATEGYYIPRAIIANVHDWADIRLAKDSQDRYVFPADMRTEGVAQLWDLPVVQTLAIPQGTALLGAFGVGDSLWELEAARIQISDSNEDDFLNNLVAIRAEEFVTHGVKVPASFCEVTLDTQPT